MRLTIFGGTGKTGQLLVRQALSEGHDVVAYVRNPAKLTVSDPRLTVVTGSLDDSAAVGEAVRGAGAVLSVLGPVRTGVAGTPVTEGIRVIVAAMKQHDVRRLVASATFSVTDALDAQPWSVRMLVGVIKRIAPGAYRDILGIGSAVRESGLDWTLVRVGLLNDRPGSGDVLSGYLGKGVKLALSRASFATFMLRQASSPDWIGKAPAISG
jgi:uncharacterized protein YbjT (DUF2867 family)